MRISKNIFSSSAVLLVGITLLGGGCATPESKPQPEADPPLAEELAPVPAPGFEDIDEMLVNPNGDEEGESQEVKENEELPVNTNEAMEEDPDPVLEPGDEDVVAEDPAPLPVVKEFKIEAKQWEFSPAVITVNEGDTVRLLITSTDVNHGFVITAFGVNTRLEAGLTQTVEFVADKKGTFSMMCNVFCGSGHGGMRGSLIVQ